MPLVPIRTLARTHRRSLMIAALAAAQAASPRLAQSGPDAAARAQRLDELFARLKTDKAEDEGDAIVAEIWKLWLQSGTASSMSSWSRRSC